MKNKIKTRYFLISLKNQIPFSIFTTIIFSLVYIFPLMFTLIEKVNFEETTQNTYYNLTTNNGFLIAALAIFAFILPIFCFKHFTDKKLTDAYYSLPIKRTELIIINVVTHLISVLIPFTIIFFSGSFMMLSIYNELLYGFYIIEYFVLIILFILYFIFNAFFYTRANAIHDGIATSVFGNFVFVLIVIAFNQLFDFRINESSLFTSFIPFMSFIEYGNYFNDLIIAKYNYKDYVISQKVWGYSYSNYEDWFKQLMKPEFIYIIVLTVIVIILIVLFIILFKKRKGENAEEKSNSKFGLAILSPTVFTCLTIVLNQTGDLIYDIMFFCGIAVFYLATTALELRTFKFPLYKILMLVGMSILVFF